MHHRRKPIFPHWSYSHPFYHVLITVSHHSTDSSWVFPFIDKQVGCSTTTTIRENLLPLQTINRDWSERTRLHPRKRQRLNPKKQLRNLRNKQLLSPRAITLYQGPNPRNRQLLQLLNPRKIQLLHKSQRLTRERDNTSIWEKYNSSTREIDNSSAQERDNLLIREINNCSIRPPTTLSQSPSECQNGYNGNRHNEWPSKPPPLSWYPQPFSPTSILEKKARR